MSVIRLVWGSAGGPTATAAYDTALAEANIHNYNIVTVSSVIPAGPPLEAVGTAPDLGPTGERLTVVQSHQSVPPGESDPAVAGIGWTRSESGKGLFYEASGTDREAVREAITDGLARGKELRDWTFTDGDVIVREADPDPDEYTSTLVCAVYGESTPLL